MLPDGAQYPRIFGAPQGNSTDPPSASLDRRLYSLDALRGLAILAMALSGLVPMGPLPQWMYHAQLIAPAMKHDPTMAGLTWVDLVFPLFLFSMGAAIPLALARRAAAGEPGWRLHLRLLRRALLLVFFAIYAQHIAPHTIANPPTQRAWWLALAGFVMLFPALTRLPRAWSPWPSRLCRIMGWLGCLGILVVLNYQPGDGIALLASRIVRRSDIILLVLANVAWFGGLIWWWTRGRWPLRVAAMAVMIVMRLSRDDSGWVQAAWDWTPAAWLYQFRYLQYLLVVLPGTIVGDLLLREQNSAGAWSRRRAIISSARSAVLCLLVLALLIGLQARRLPETVLACILLYGVGEWLFRGPADDREGREQAVFRWGSVWLAVGLCFEPFEGGIRKDPATLSYYFVTVAAACFLLAGFSIVLRGLRPRRALRLLTETGQNPMIAYVGIRSLLAPAAALTGLESASRAVLATPWQGVLRAALKTLLLAVFVAWCTRRRIVWRT